MRCLIICGFVVSTILVPWIVSIFNRFPQCSGQPVFVDNPCLECNFSIAAFRMFILGHIFTFIFMARHAKI